MNLSSLLGKPNLKALEAPIRSIVHEVLREQGYASPAEVQAIRDDARDLRGRLDRAESRLTELAGQVESVRAEAARATAEAVRAATEAARAVPAPVATPVAAPVEDPRIGELVAEVARLRERLESHPAPAEAEAAPLSAAPRAGCKVPGCADGVRSKGFCSAHYQQWRRGTLKGFVGLDGMVEAGGRTISVGADHAGGHLEIDGNRILVDGQLVVELAAAS